VLEIIVEETGLPLKFPDPRIEAAERAREFQALSGAERLRSALETDVRSLSPRSRRPSGRHSQAPRRQCEKSTDGTPLSRRRAVRAPLPRRG